MSFRHRRDPALLSIYTSRNSEWVLDAQELRSHMSIYTSRNSEWVLDFKHPVPASYIYTSRNSEWVLDTGSIVLSSPSTLVEILNEF